MRLALITTTINEPTVLALYRKLDPDVRFFIAGDLKSPHDKIRALCDRIGNAVYLHPDDQQQYKCSSLIGWNCIQRRNIALLEALKWGATHIYSMDDDNIPVDHIPALDIEIGFHIFDGIAVKGFNGWFDVGKLLVPQAKHRGIPHNANKNTLWCVKPVTDTKVGVVAGICLGDPDIDATTRVEHHPEVHQVSELLRAGIVVDPNTHTVFNSQNTAFVSDLAPCMFMLPGVGRYDDIFASLITQRVMREHGYHVHFGKPFVWQSRNPHNLLDDLKAEIYGMERVQKLATYLDAVQLVSDTPLSQFREIVDSFARAPVSFDLLPAQTCAAMEAWRDDVEQAMTELPL